MNLNRTLSIGFVIAAVYMMFKGDYQNAIITLIFGHFNALSADLQAVKELLSKENNEK